MNFAILEGLFFEPGRFGHHSKLFCAHLYTICAGMRRKEKVAYWVNCGALHHAKTRGAAVLPSIGCGGSKKKTAVWGLPICRERIEQTTTWVPSALVSDFAECLESDARCCADGAMET